MDKFSSINIREYLVQNAPDGIGEADLQVVISDFSCSKNLDVENFLKKNAVEFAKKHQSVTYLVFSNEDSDLVGYFTIAIKPITVNAGTISNTARRRLQRISRLDENAGTYTASAYLIAQLGKNFSHKLDSKISGEELLDAAWNVIQNLQYAAGGVVSFLEAERNEKLLAFYRSNGFREFDIKTITDGNGEQRELVQLLRFM